MEKRQKGCLWKLDQCLSLISSNNSSEILVCWDQGWVSIQLSPFDSISIHKLSIRFSISTFWKCINYIHEHDSENDISHDHSDVLHRAINLVCDGSALCRPIGIWHQSITTVWLESKQLLKLLNCSCGTLMFYTDRSVQCRCILNKPIVLKMRFLAAKVTYCAFNVNSGERNCLCVITCIRFKGDAEY